MVAVWTEAWPAATAVGEPRFDRGAGSGVHGGGGGGGDGHGVRDRAGDGGDDGGDDDGDGGLSADVRDAGNHVSGDGVGGDPPSTVVAPPAQPVHSHKSAKARKNALKMLKRRQD